MKNSPKADCIHLSSIMEEAKSLVLTVEASITVHNDIQSAPHTGDGSTTSCNSTAADVSGLTSSTTMAAALDPWGDSRIITYCFWFHGVVLVAICIVGVITNLLNIAVLSMAVRKRNSVIHKLFLCMAVADLVTMTIHLSIGSMFGIQEPDAMNLYENIHPPDLKAPYFRYLWYQSSFFFSNVTSSISNWMAVLMGLFRLIAASFPLKAGALTSNIRVNISMAIVIVGLILLSVPYWTVFRISEYGAIKRVQDREGLATISIAFCYFVPVTLCLIFTIALIAKLSKRKSIMPRLASRSQEDTRKREQKQITVTLLLISVFFIITNIPVTLVYVICLNFWWDELNIARAEQWLYYLIGIDIVMVGNACNFFIYIVGSAPFRRDLLKMLRIRSSVKSAQLGYDRTLSRASKTISCSSTSANQSSDNSSTSLEDNTTINNNDEIMNNE